MPEWTDLLDPSPEELRRHLPKDIHPRALEQLLASAKHDDEPRPKLEGHGNYIFGVFLVPVVVPNEDRIYYQEVDLIGTRDGLLTVRKTPERGKPFDISPAQAACRADEGVGMNAYHLIDEIAERYLDLIDGMNDEIDELEENVEDWEPQKTRARLSGLKHDLLHVRRTLSPMRDAVRGVVDDRVELDDGGPMLTREVELNFAAAYDKFLRAVGRARAVARSCCRRPRLPAVQDRERSERGDEEADGDRVGAPPPHVHRRSLRAELRTPFPGARLAMGLRLVLGPDRRDHDRAARLLQAARLDLAQLP